MDPGKRATSEFWRMMRWIVVIAVGAVLAAIAYLAATGELTANLVIATSIGVFLTVIVGSGLFAVSYLSSKGGHDEAVSDATRSERERR